MASRVPPQATATCDTKETDVKHTFIEPQPELVLTAQDGSGFATMPRRLPGAANYRLWLKRPVDLALAIVMLPALVPVIALLWLIVRLDGGHGFFGHTRVGRDGTAFRCWKLRTMVMDAEARLAAHLATDPQAAAEWAANHKLEQDPRITRIGRFLRKTSLDELPQIWNVLCGQMSFVGPRPVVLAELERYGQYRWAYLRLRPGITGLWQVSGRNAVSYDERVGLDVRYQAEIGFWSDLRIIAKTAGAVLRCTGN